MAVVLIEKDPFTTLDKRLQENPYESAYNVRRPLYGVAIKEPTFAHVAVYQDMGEGNEAQAISILDSSAPSGVSQANHNFILQSVTEQRQEKVQIIETFGDHFSFFYGEKPIVLQCQGMLFNTKDFNWKNEFLANYDRFLRGTKCAENRTRVYLGFDDVLAQGYMLNVALSYDKDMPLVVPFSFSLLLTKPPMDLSAANQALIAPQSAATSPWDYRSLEGAFEFDGAAYQPYLPEYLTPPNKSEFIELSELTQEPIVLVPEPEEVPEATMDRVYKGLERDEEVIVNRNRRANHDYEQAVQEEVVSNTAIVVDYASRLSFTPF